MSRTGYEAVPMSPDDESVFDPGRTERAGRRPHIIHTIDPRFHEPTPAAWKRAALLLFIAFMFWLAFNLPKPKVYHSSVVYTDKYSNEFKYRPAASPVITKVLKDGRTLIMGAEPTM